MKPFDPTKPPPAPPNRGWGYGLFSGGEERKDNTETAEYKIRLEEWEEKRALLKI